MPQGGTPTPNKGFPQYKGSDNTAWTDINNLMGMIDLSIASAENQLAGKVVNQEDIDENLVAITELTELTNSAINSANAYLAQISSKLDNAVMRTGDVLNGNVQAGQLSFTAKTTRNIFISETEAFPSGAIAGDILLTYKAPPGGNLIEGENILADYEITVGATVSPFEGKTAIRFPGKTGLIIGGYYFNAFTLKNIDLTNISNIIINYEGVALNSLYYALCINPAGSELTGDFEITMTLPTGTKIETLDVSQSTGIKDITIIGSHNTTNASRGVYVNMLSLE